MINPNKYIRQAIISAMSLQGYSVFYKRIPKGVSSGNAYVIISDMGKGQRDKSRCGYEWTCTVTLNVYTESVNGMPPTTTLDELEETVHNVVRVLKVGNGFWTKMVNLANQTDLEEFAADRTIDRRVLSYEIWLSNASKSNP